MSSPVSVQIDQHIAWVTIDSPPVNATSTAVRMGLMDAVNAIQDSDAKLAALVCAGKTFVAGGDMSEFDAAPVAPHLPDVVDAIEQSKTPFAALLHGSVLGGGFEIAMACAFRIAQPGTRFGLPEINVGVIPGAGGTQRAPRLLGWDIAFELVCLAQQKTADEMLAIGAVDLIVDDPKAAAPSFLEEKPVPVSTRTVETLTAERLAGFKARAARFAKGRKAPLHSLDTMVLASRPYAEGQPKERALHLELRASDESRALRHQFFAERAVARPAIIKKVASKAIAEVAIVGGGLMGSGIAAACLNAGLGVGIVERDATSAENAQTSVEGYLRGALDRGKISEADFSAQVQALTVTQDYGDVAGADLAIEAVFEDLSAKQDVIRALSDVVSSDALLATNTSYLNPDQIFDGIAHPGRCLGIHFFSPAHIMKLVEVVQASGTTPETLATTFQFAKSLRKIPVLSGICDGFIGNRILAAYRRAAEYMLADGALPEQVDSAMRAFGMAMGPFEAQDMAGLQIAFANRRRQDATRPKGERYVSISDRLCARERFGKRAGKGWYSYSEDYPKGAPDPFVTNLIEGYSADHHLVRRVFSQADIQSQLMVAMANEGARLVDEGIAESAAAIDVVKVAGYGFPRWRGGPMHWAEMTGDSAIKDALSDLEAASPGSWTRARCYQQD